MNDYNPLKIAQFVGNAAPTEGTPFAPSYMDKAKTTLDWLYGKDNAANNAAFGSVPGAGGDIQPPLGQWLNQRPNLKGGLSQAMDMSMFIGPNANLSPRQSQQLSLANILSKAGKFDNNHIHNRTGWFMSPENKWIGEIADDTAGYNFPNIELAKYTNKMKGRSADDPVFMKMKDAYNHPELYKLYPEIENMIFRLEDMHKDYGGVYDPGANQISINKKYFDNSNTTMLHELQHKIQNIEGRTQGTDWNTFGGKESYRRNAGEVEARATEKRRILDQKERMYLKPWQSYDVPMSQILYNLGTPKF